MDLTQLEGRIVADIGTSTTVLDNARYLCDKCNGRFAGTADERRAGDFLMQRFREYGLQNVAAESYEIPGWKRGEARLTLLDDDAPRDIPCLAMAGAAGGYAETEIIDAGPGAAEDYERLGGAAAGKVALSGPEGPGRAERYAEAHKAGAAGFLFAGGEPGHMIPAGSLRLHEITAKIPGVALSLESTTYIRRRLAEGPLRARLSSLAETHPATARNIVGQIPGTDPAAGWIIVCGHYDGHDIAQGAQDNATGTVTALEVARVLSPLREHLKVGLRFVLFSAEEIGIHGSPAYVRDHPNDLDQIRVVYNADIVGVTPPLVLHTQNSPELAAYLRGLPLTDLDAVVNDKGLVNNTDHFAFTLKGISSLWAVTSPTPPPGRGWVHTTADTFDKLELRNLRGAATTSARVLLRMAMAPEKLPQGRKPLDEVKKAVVDAGLEKLLRLSGRWPFD